MSRRIQLKTFDGDARKYVNEPLRRKFYLKLFEFVIYVVIPVILIYAIVAGR